MNYALSRSITPTQQRPVFFSLNQLRPMTSEMKIKQTIAVHIHQETKQVVDDAEELSNEEHGDVMSDSFGEAYATRCDEEGFGGIYRSDQSLCDPEHKVAKKIPENDPHYDKTQGSAVKEK